MLSKAIASSKKLNRLKQPEIRRLYERHALKIYYSFVGYIYSANLMWSCSGTRDPAMKKTDKVPALMELTTGEAGNKS